MLLKMKIYTIVNLIKNLKSSNLNTMYDYYYLCFEDGYEFIRQPLNELQLIGYFNVKCYNHNNYTIVFDKLNKLIEENEYINDFIKSCKLQNNNIILACKKIHSNENGLKFLSQIIKPLIGTEIEFINIVNEQP